MDINEQKEHLKKITDLQINLVKASNNGIKYMPSTADWDVIDRALACHYAVIDLDIKRQERAIECGCPDRQTDLRPHSEERIVKECIKMMHSLVTEIQRWYEFLNGEDSVDNMDDEEIFAYRMSTGEIVRQLLLSGTGHSGGVSTSAKCRELGLDYFDEITFGFERCEDD